MKISLPIKLGAYALIVLISAGFAYNYYTEVTEALAAGGAPPVLRIDELAAAPYSIIEGCLREH